MKRLYLRSIAVVLLFQIIASTQSKKTTSVNKKNETTLSEASTTTENTINKNQLSDKTTRSPATKNPTARHIAIPPKSPEPIDIRALPGTIKNSVDQAPPVNFKTPGSLKVAQEQIERHKKELMKPKAPIMPSLKIETTPLPKSPTIPMPRICADGRPCDKLI